MRLASVDICGFRGYRKRLRLEFADRFTIIDGRNGVGKVRSSMPSSSP
jgi:chromosome segregation protein